MKTSQLYVVLGSMFCLMFILVATRTHTTYTEHVKCPGGRCNKAGMSKADKILSNELSKDKAVTINQVCVPTNNNPSLKRIVL